MIDMGRENIQRERRNGEKNKRDKERQKERKRKIKRDGTIKKSKKMWVCYIHG